MINPEKLDALRAAHQMRERVHRDELLAYRKANRSGRAELLRAKILSIESLQGEPQAEAQAMLFFWQLTNTASFINYADALRRIENQDYFDILIDFKMPHLLTERLSEFFEFHPSAPQMRLKRSLQDIPTDIWVLFREAQKVRLEELGKKELFDLDQLPISPAPDDQLYPLPIQMFGKYENEAVDRPTTNSEGKYRFNYLFGVYVLAGGGMIEINLENSMRSKIGKMLDEHLEELHGNLWKKAAQEYDTISKEQFNALISKQIEKLKKSSDELAAQLHDMLGEPQSNADRLRTLIARIDHIKEEKTFVDHKLLNEVRAGIQVETFKETALYQDALQHVMKDIIMLDVEQVGDTRACGGKQIAHVFFSSSQELPLEKWFKQRFKERGISKEDNRCELADDMSNGQRHYFTLLEAIRHFRQIKFSHLRIITTEQELRFLFNTSSLRRTWDTHAYHDARDSLIKEGKQLLEKLTSETLSPREKRSALGDSLYATFGGAAARQEDEGSSDKEEPRSFGKNRRP